MTEFAWTKPRIEAAQLLAEDDLTDAEIASQVGVTRAGLAKWKVHPSFAGRVAEIVAEIESEIRIRGIARQMKRVDALQHRWLLMKRVIAERSEADEMQGVAGGTTGLLVRTFKVVGNGPDAHVVPEFAVDTGLLKELREHEKQAAQELGQWTEKKQVTGRDGSPLIPEQPFDYDGFARTFADFIGGAGAGLVGDAGTSEPMDSADPD